MDADEWAALPHLSMDQFTKIQITLCLLLDIAIIEWAVGYACLFVCVTLNRERVFNFSPLSLDHKVAPGAFV